MNQEEILFILGEGHETLQKLNVKKALFSYKTALKNYNPDKLSKRHSRTVGNSIYELYKKLHILELIKLAHKEVDFKNEASLQSNLIEIKNSYSSININLFDNSPFCSHILRSNEYFSQVLDNFRR
jgi:hypothetical protein